MHTISSLINVVRAKFDSFSSLPGEIIKVGAFLSAPDRPHPPIKNSTFAESKTANISKHLLAVVVGKSSFPEMRSKRSSYKVPRSKFSTFNKNKLNSCELSKINWSFEEDSAT